VLTPEWIDGIAISVLVGENAAGERVVLVDRDNDGDFAGEPPLRFQPDTLVAGDRRIPIESATASVSFEYYEHGRVKGRTAPLRFVYQEGAAPEQLKWHVAEHPVGRWVIRGQSFTVGLGAEAVFRPGRYDSFFVDVDDNGRFDPNPDGLEAYSIADPLNVGAVGWRIVGGTDRSGRAGR
jgi:hypothetical protein